MIKLMDISDGYEATLEQKRLWILTAVVTDFADDKELLKKLNQITFGLIKESNLF